MTETNSSTSSSNTSSRWHPLEIASSLRGDSIEYTRVGTEDIHDDDEEDATGATVTRQFRSGRCKTKYVVLTVIWAVAMFGIGAGMGIFLFGRYKNEENGNPEESSVADFARESDSSIGEEIQEDDPSAEKQQRPIIRAQQIQSYRNETGLILNVHITHHGGTSFCRVIGRHGIHGGIAPDFACLHDRDGIMPNPPVCKTDPAHSGVDPSYCYGFREMQRDQTPWGNDQTAPFVHAIRPYFHMVSWEFRGLFQFKAGRSLDDTNWDCPDLVSVVVTRDPISRLLAGDGNTGRKYPGWSDAKLGRTEWWDLALYENNKNTDNYFLRFMANQELPRRTTKQQQISNHAREGINRTTEKLMELFPTGLNETHYKRARALLDKFTFVLDIACLGEGMAEIGRQLGLDLPELRRSLQLWEQSEEQRLLKDHTHPPSRERIAHDDVYEYLLAKNHWDIALYNYSKTISTVNCEDLKDGGA